MRMLITFQSKTHETKHLEGRRVKTNALILRQTISLFCLLRNIERMTRSAHLTCARSRTVPLSKTQLIHKTPMFPNTQRALNIAHTPQISSWNTECCLCCGGKKKVLLLNTTWSGKSMIHHHLPWDTRAHAAEINNGRGRIPTDLKGESHLCAHALVCVSVPVRAPAHMCYYPLSLCASITTSSCIIQRYKIKEQPCACWRINGLINDERDKH